VRHGKLFRSDVLSQLTDPDLDKLAPLGIRLVMDLRMPEERHKEQNRWPAGHPVDTVTFDARPAMAEAQATRWRDLVAAGQLSGKEARGMMFGVYRRMPRSLASDLTVLFERLDTQEPPTTLIHCTAGKDRSGFVCAMLLWSLGVPMETILEDYLITGQRRPPERFAAERLAGLVDTLTEEGFAVLKAFAMVDEDYLATAFEQIRADFGSVDAYLEALCGLDGARRERLRAKLID
jgi:protein-tyrosine phosphatase